MLIIGGVMRRQPHIMKGHQGWTKQLSQTSPVVWHHDVSYVFCLVSFFLCILSFVVVVVFVMLPVGQELGKNQTRQNFELLKIWKCLLLNKLPISFSSYAPEMSLPEMLGSNLKTVFVLRCSSSAHCTTIWVMVISDLMASALVNVILSLKYLGYIHLVVHHMVK